MTHTQRILILSVGLLAGTVLLSGCGEQVSTANGDLSVMIDSARHVACYNKDHDVRNLSCVALDSLNRVAK